MSGSEAVTQVYCDAKHRAYEREMEAINAKVDDTRSWLDKIDKRIWSLMVGIVMIFIGVIANIILSLAKVPQ